MAPTLITLKGDQVDRSVFEAVLKRRLFFTEAFEIYRLSPDYKGDNRGLFDYGPPGCALLANIVDVWRRHFVLEENMLEVDCTVITPAQVLKTSARIRSRVRGTHSQLEHCRLIHKSRRLLASGSPCRKCAEGTA
jgi:glycyl-tRNA synthetase